VRCSDWIITMVKDGNDDDDEKKDRRDEKERDGGGGEEDGERQRRKKKKSKKKTGHPAVTNIADLFSTQSTEPALEALFKSNVRGPPSPSTSRWCPDLLSSPDPCCLGRRRRGQRAMHSMILRCTRLRLSPSPQRRILKNKTQSTRAKSGNERKMTESTTLNHVT
jgi:hypothetical protein